jgi:Domain of unknown function (DUF4926)
MRFKQYDVVKLVKGFPEDGVPPGTKAVVLEVLDKPQPHYEVEVVFDDDGQLYTAGVDEDGVDAA